MGCVTASLCFSNVLFICSICPIIWITKAEPRAHEGASPHPTLTACPWIWGHQLPGGDLQLGKESPRVFLYLRLEKGRLRARETAKG